MLQKMGQMKEINLFLTPLFIYVIDRVLDLNGY